MLVARPLLTATSGRGDRTLLLPPPPRHPATAPLISSAPPLPGAAAIGRRWGCEVGSCPHRGELSPPRPSREEVVAGRGGDGSVKGEAE